MGKSPNGRLALREGFLFSCFGGLEGGVLRLLDAGIGSGDKIEMEMLCHGWLYVGCTE